MAFDLGLVGDIFDGLDAGLGRVDGIVGGVADIANSAVGIAEGVARIEQAGDDQDFREDAQDAFILDKKLAAERGDNKQIVIAIAGGVMGLALLVFVLKGKK